MHCPVLRYLVAHSSLSMSGSEIARSYAMPVCGTETARYRATHSRGTVRYCVTHWLVRWLEKVLGATKLTVTNLAVRYRHLALEDGEEDGDEDGLSPCPSNRTGQSSRGKRIEIDVHPHPTRPNRMHCARSLCRLCGEAN
eukprot:2276250-Rhodomonas_salina.1